MTVGKNFLVRGKRNIPITAQDVCRDEIITNKSERSVLYIKQLKSLKEHDTTGQDKMLLH